MKILHITKDFSVPSQTFIYDLVTGLESCEGIQNTVVFYRKRFLVDERPFEQVRFIGKRPGRTGRIKRRLLYKNSTEYEISKTIQNALKEEQPDVIHCHFAWTIWDCLRHFTERQTLDIPVIISVHGTDILHSGADSQKNMQYLEEFYRKHTVKFTATNQFMRHELQKKGIKTKDIVIVPCAVKFDFFAERKTDYFQKTHRFKIANTGRLILWKGHEYLMHAFARFVNEIYSDSELSIIGDGPLMQDLLELSRELKIENKVKFLGSVSHARVVDVLKQQNLYIHPSIMDVNTGQCEAFGISILEAIGIGLPVIVTDTGGMPEIIGHPSEFAYVVPEKDSGELFLAMKKVFECQVTGPLDNYEYAKERFDCFSQRKQLSTCLSIYSDIIRSNSV